MYIHSTDPIPEARALSGTLALDDQTRTGRAWEGVLPKTRACPGLCDSIHARYPSGDLFCGRIVSRPLLAFCVVVFSGNGLVDSASGRSGRLVRRPLVGLV